VTLTVPTRTDHLAEVLTALHPPPYAFSGDGPVAAEYRVLPYQRRPRLLVPARLAAAGVRSATARTPLTRLAAAALSLPGAARLLPTVRVYGDPAADSFATHLGTVLDARRSGLAGRPPELAILVGGPARANRKPVVAALDPQGDPLCFAKLGTGPLTRALVRNERAALRTLVGAGLRYTQVPTLLSGGAWRDHEVIVQSALPTWRGSTPGPDLLTRAMCEVARACGSSRGRLGDGTYWWGLQSRVMLADDHRLSAAAERLQDTAGDLQLEYGAWHGDWTPWNTRHLDGRVLVWDWERFAVGVPLGFDALHYALARQAPVSGHLLAPLARDLLAPFGVPPAAAEATASLYLIEIATRYLIDGQRTAAARTVTDMLGDLS